MGHYFTYITGIVTILAFILQIRDVFPRYREARKTTMLLVAGVFVGSALGSINSFDIRFETGLRPIEALLLVSLVVLMVGIAVLLAIAVTSKNYKKRKELYNLIGGGIFAFFLLILTGLSLSRVSLLDLYNKSDPLSSQELVSLASFHLEKRDYESALKYLDRLLSGYKFGDPRRMEIEYKIKRVKEQMAESMSHSVDKK